MKRIFVALCALVACAAQAVELAKLVPNKSAVFLHVPSAPRLLEQFEKSPLSKTYRDERMQKFIAPALAKLDLAAIDEKQKATSGLSFKEMLALPRGEILLTFIASAEKASPLLLVDVGAENEAKVSNALKQFLQDRNKDTLLVEQTEEAIADLTLHTVTATKQVKPDSDSAPGGDRPEPKPDVFYWFLKSGILVYGDNRDQVVNVAIAIGEGGVSDSLAQSDAFLRHLDRLQGEGVGLAVDFNSLTPVIQAQLASRTGPGPKNPVTDPEAIARTLGIYELDTLYADLRLEDQQMVTQAGLRYRSFTGLVTLMALGAGPAPQPEFVPDSWLAVNSLRLRPADMFAAVEGLFQQHHASVAAMFSANVSMAGARFGFDIKRDLFGSFGDEVVVATAARPGVPLEKMSAFDVDEVYALSVTDPKSLAKVIDALVQQFDPQNKGVIARKEFGGTTIYSLPLPPDPVRGVRFANICLWQDRFFVSLGTPAPIEAAILTATRKEGIFWQREDVRRAFADTPADAGGFAFQDNRVMISMAIETISRLAEMAEKQGVAEQGPMVDPSSKPEITDLAKYWSSSYGFIRRDANSLSFVSKLPYVQ